MDSASMAIREVEHSKSTTLYAMHCGQRLIIVPDQAMCPDGSCRRDKQVASHREAIL